MMSAISALLLTFGWVQSERLVRYDKAVRMCIEQQVDLYDDLCMEEMDKQSHYDGVDCAVRYIKHCLEAEGYSEDTHE